MNTTKEQPDICATEQILSRLWALEDELVRLRESRCQRCSEPPPPLERWHGDPRARDERPACSCGRQVAWSL